MNLSPIQLLREAIKAVPALKYALGVAGLIAVVAIVGVFRIRPEIAVFGAIATLVLMVPLLVFARLTKTAQKHFLVPALVLMWAFLVLVIAAASLLFSSTFFRWPMDFRPLPPASTKTTAQVTQTSVTAEVKGALESAELQLSARNFEGAWKTLQGAAALQPQSDAVLDAQVDVAMAWLRNLVVRAPRTFTEVVDQLTPVFYKALPKAKGSRAGDICAHIGWAYFQRSRENPSTVDIDAEFRKAIEKDPKNTYGHAMLAHRLLQHSGNVAVARQHFDIALATKRDHEWVRGMQHAALKWIDADDHKLELARVANEMRKSGEEISKEQKARLFTEIYWFGAHFAYLTNLIHSLPASEHLETLEWVAAAKGWNDSWPQQRFVRAELRERSGDWSGALEIYASLSMLGDGYQEEIKSAIARCRLQARGK